MIRLNIDEAKTHLSKYLARLRSGQSIVLCKRNEPIAEIRPLPKRRRKPRPIGIAKGKFRVPRSFFEPLPNGIQAAFKGRVK